MLTCVRRSSKRVKIYTILWFDIPGSVSYVFNFVIVWYCVCPPKSGLGDHEVIQPFTHGTDISDRSSDRSDRSDR